MRVDNQSLVISHTGVQVECAAFEIHHDRVLFSPSPHASSFGSEVAVRQQRFDLRVPRSEKFRRSGGTCNQPPEVEVSN